MSDGRAQAAVLAGGAGTRLRSRTGGLPKAMTPVAGRPLIEHQLARCREAGLERVLLLLHHGHEHIQSHVGDGSRFGLQVRHVVESAPRGTAGALHDALPLLDECFLVLYGDTYFDVDLRALWQAHAGQQADVTLFVHPNDHPQDSDLVELDAQGWVRALHAYPHPPGATRRNLVNAAMYVVRREALAGAVPAEGLHDLARDTFPALLAAGRRLAGWRSVEYIKDMGTPERLDKVEADLAAGLPQRLAARQPRTAVLLDRDGTLNAEVGHLARPQDLALLPGAAAAVRRLNRSGVLAVVATNQPVIARGELTEAGLDAVHARLDALLGEGHAYLDALYHCPHHPDRGFAGEVAALKIRCDCRKPEAGLIDRACRELRIDRRRSWMVGDSTVDLLAGQRAGLRTVLVRTGQGGRDGRCEAQPDYVMPGLPEAVDWVLEGHARAARRAAAAVAAACGRRLVLVGGLARAGKSTLAQLLKEGAEQAGQRAHVVCLDGWLRPPAERAEGTGVLARFELERAAAELAALAQARRHHDVAWPLYDRTTRLARPGPTAAVGPQDLLIVEGVPALAHDGLLALADLRLHVEVGDGIRRRRFEADAALRGRDAAEAARLFTAREADETPVVQAAARAADLCIALEDDR